MAKTYEDGKKEGFDAGFHMASWMVQRPALTTW